jgi:hypothetical protein
MHQSSDDHFFLGCGRKCFRAGPTAAFIWPAITALLLSTLPAWTAAKIEVYGQSDALRLTAEDVPISEVMAALSTKFNLTYSSEVQLDRTVVGTYSGTLLQVMRRILDGYDYVINVSVERIELKILSRSGSVAKPSTLPAPPSQAAAATPNPIAPPALNRKPAEYRVPKLSFPIVPAQ